MVRTSHSKAVQKKPQGLTEQQPTPPVSTSCVFFFGYLHPGRQQLRARVAPLAHGYHGARRHGADTPNQHLPHYLHYLHARRAGAMPRSPVVLSWMSPCWVTALSPCCGDSRSGPARRQSSEHCARRGTQPGQQQGTEPAPEQSWIISPLLHEPTAPGAALAPPGGSPSPSPSSQELRLQSGTGQSAPAPGIGLGGGGKERNSPSKMQDLAGLRSTKCHHTVPPCRATKSQRRAHLQAPCHGTATPLLLQPPLPPPAVLKDTPK